MKKVSRSSIRQCSPLALVMLICSSASQAQVCEAPSLANFQLNLPSSAPKDLGPEEVWVDADQIDGDRSQITAKGNAYLIKDGNVVTGDVVHYDRVKGTASTANSIIAQNGLVTKSKEAHYGGKNAGSELAGVDYFLRANGAHGTADKISSEIGNSTFEASNITYTTCNASNPTWWIEANRLNLNQDTNRGIARNAVVKIKGVPVFYSPYLPFFTNGQRATGLLIPKAAYSGNNGYTYIQPIYFNLAPNYDATLNIGNISNQGYFAGQEFRYLTKRNQGEIINQHLFYRDDRDNAYMRRWTHLYQNNDLLGGNLGQIKFAIDYNSASDANVLDQIETSLYATDTDHLKQAASLSWSRAIGNAQLQLTTEYRQYQSLNNESSSPYAYKPKIKLSAKGDLPLTIADSPLKWSLESSWTQLRHPTKSSTNRWISQAGLSHSIYKPYGFLNTRISLKRVDISLPEVTDSETDSEFAFTAPTLEIDSGLTFEKKFNNGMKHEISPRLYYTYTPHKDQTNSPTLEASTRGDSISSLFQPSRFIGDERIADTNKVSVSLENKLYKSDGSELVSVKMAQSFYNDSPKINLDGSSSDKDLSRSDAYLEARARLTKALQADMSARFDYDDYSLETYATGLSFRKNKYAARLGFSDNRTENDDKSVNLSGKIAVTNEINLLGRVQYNIDQESTNEHILGIEYNNCCGTVRFGVRNQRDNFTEEFKRRYLLEFEVGELGTVSAGESFTNRIFGF